MLTSTETLLGRRKETKERHRHLETFKGSGWHQYDPSSPHSQGLMPLAQRPVAFIGADDVVLVGGCAGQVVAALESFREKHADEASGDGADHQLKRAVAACTRYRLSGEGDEARLEVNRLRWNDVLWALAEEGVQVCSTGLED